MYVIIAYDIGVERLNKVKALLRKYLNWVQNSVFEGEITPAKLEELKYEIREIIDENQDSIVIYIFRAKPAVKREIIGVEKGEIGEVI